MSLKKGKFIDVPPDAIILTENEALEYQLKILKNWSNTSDVFAFKIGPWILSGAAFVSSFYINNHFRRKLKLSYYGRASTYLPNCVIPTALSLVLHSQFVIYDVVLQKTNVCPICIELRASAFQAFSSVIIPTTLSTLSSLNIAHRYATYNVPYITQDTKKVFILIKKIIKPIFGVLIGMFIGQALLGSIITYFESRSVQKVNNKLLSFEK